MATQLVPYNTAMQLGSGFNSFTQTLCIDNAVTRDSNLAIEEKTPEEKKEIQVAQNVVYKTSIIDKTTDVTDEMNINGAFNIKYDQLAVDGSGKFVNTNKIKESDFSIMVSVKVVNQVIYDHSLTKFQPITNMKDASAQRLVEVYGDCFISGWQEGGEFLAVISIKAKNREEAQTIAAEARVAFSKNKDPPAGSTQKEIGLNLDAKFNKVKANIAAENEVSVSVTWTGGGQQLKKPEQDWDFDTMKDVALKFPDLCAKTPMRTHAILTKYTALRSFHMSHSFELPVYDKTGTYTNVLQEAYLDYKSILASIQVLSFEVAEGTKALVVNPRAAKAAEQTKSSTGDAGDEAGKPRESAPTNDAESIDGSVVDVPTTIPSKAPAPIPKFIKMTAPAIEEPFTPSIVGLEEARLQCRYMMNRIIQEIDNITVKPEIATDETRTAPYLSPFLFKMLLPIAVALPAEGTQAAQAVAASQAEGQNLNQFTGLAPSA